MSGDPEFISLAALIIVEANHRGGKSNHRWREPGSNVGPAWMGEDSETASYYLYHGGSTGLSLGGDMETGETK